MKVTRKFASKIKSLCQIGIAIVVLMAFHGIYKINMNESLEWHRNHRSLIADGFKRQGQTHSSLMTIYMLCDKQGLTFNDKTCLEVATMSVNKEENIKKAVSDFLMLPIIEPYKQKVPNHTINLVEGFNYSWNSITEKIRQ